MKNLFCFLSIFYFFMVLSQERQNFIEDLVYKKELLSVENPFDFFPLVVSLQEKKAIESLKIEKEKSLRFYIFGNRICNQDEISLFLQSQGNSIEQSNSVASVLHKFIADTLAALDVTCAFVLIEAAKPDLSFDCPRWHIDGPYFKNDEMYQYKIVAALQGQATLFCNITDDQVKQDFSQLFQKRSTIAGQKATRFEHENLYRHKTEKIVEPYLKQQVPKYHGAIFLIGGSFFKAAYHAKPVINCDRLFISIVPGTKDQIEFLSKN